MTNTTDTDDLPPSGAPPVAAGTKRSPSLTPRDARLVLWLAVAAVSGRWLLGVRTPLPTVDACVDLWRAGRLLAGDVAGWAAGWWQPWGSLLLAALTAVGSEPFAAAQVLACVAGGLVAWPVAVAAERLREGAGVPAAVLAVTAGVAFAAAGSSVALLGLLVAVAAAAWVTARPVWAALFATAAAAGCVWLAAITAPVGGRGAVWALALPVALAVASGLPPRPARIRGLWLAAASVAAVVLVTRQVAVAACAAPCVLVLAAVALARLPVRLRDVLLCVATLVAGAAAWHDVEPRAAVAERVLGRWLRHRVEPGRELVTMAPRVAFFAGRPPAAVAAADVFAAAAAEGVQALVSTAAAARDATRSATLASRFVRYELPADLVDLCDAQGLVLYWRRE
jgi:hypothetical protein